GARTAVPAPAPPTDVAAAAVNGSQARISWRNTASFQYVVISLGNGPGIRTRAFPNRSPQLFTGLDPGKPYCFAVGYEYDPGAKPPAYSVVTGKACINGGVPEPGG